MAYARIQHGGGAVDTTLGGDITSGATSLSLVSSTNWPDGSIGSFYIIIDPGTSVEEKILATSRTSLTLNGLSRGADGTSAQAHSAGAVIKHIFSATEADEANQIVHNTLGTVAAKGDLLPGTAANTIGKLTVGADNTVLVAASGQTTGLNWQTLGSSSLATGSVTSTQIAAGAVVTAGLAANAVTTAKLALQAVDDTIISTAAVDGTTLTGGGGSVLAVKSGGISTTQLASASVTNPILATGAVKFANFDSTIRPVTICTSSTRPSSPSIGDRIFETDTGNELTFQSATTSWTKPWNLPWGALDYVQGTANVDTSGTTETTIVTSDSLTLVANRIITVEFHCANVQPINNVSWVKVWVTDAANTHLEQMSRDQLTASSTQGMDRRVRLTPAAGTFQVKIRAQYGDAGGAARFSANSSLSGDPGPLYVRILDDGPTGAPA